LKREFVCREVEPGMTESQPAIQREGLIYVKEPFRNDISSTKIRKLLSQVTLPTSWRLVDVQHSGTCCES